MKDRRQWLNSFARLGYGAKAVIYLTISAMIFRRAIGIGRTKADPNSALEAISSHPGGTVALVVVLAGLGCYVIWRLVTAFAPLEGKPKGLAGWSERVARLASGAVYAGLAVVIVRLLLGGDAGDSEGDMEAGASEAMKQPSGSWTVIIAGLVAGGVGIRFLFEACVASYRREFTMPGASAGLKTFVDRVARVGVASRGLVFLLVGVFLLEAGWNSDAKRVRGMGEAIAVLEGNPLGPWFQGAVAVGFAAYAGYCIVRARYGHLKV